MKGRRRAGFIYIVGWRVITTRERKPEIVGTCPQCRRADARLIGRVRRAWFTMFFIPILPLDPAERAQRVSQCRDCGTMFEMPIEQLARRCGAMAAVDFAETIAAYNDLRDHPTDSRLMLKLLRMYEQLNEPAEAEAAARHFPQALDAECAAVLERLRESAKVDQSE